jgi:ATP-binding protein involved in chromosome partitioning
VPLSVALREGGDAGTPIVLQPGDAAGDAITELATAIARRGRGLAGSKLGLAPR